MCASRKYRPVWTHAHLCMNGLEWLEAAKLLLPKAPTRRWCLKRPTITIAKVICIMHHRFDIIVVKSVHSHLHQVTAAISISIKYSTLIKFCHLHEGQCHLHLGIRHPSSHISPSISS
mmetsp:Transcript_31339/g.58432  ORF Transcript_31339/g.58432 Transcript_31339/m.58432 type:complete len:118 (+) Transcript_31339:98-451(+)